MNRRDLLKHLAAIPFVGAMFSGSAVSAVVKPVAAIGVDVSGGLTPSVDGIYIAWDGEVHYMTFVNGLLVRIEKKALHVDHA